MCLLTVNFSTEDLFIIHRVLRIRLATEKLQPTTSSYLVLVLTNKNLCLKNDTDINRPVDQAPTGLYQHEAEAETTLCNTTSMIRKLCQSTPWHPDAKFQIDVFRGERRNFPRNGRQGFLVFDEVSIQTCMCG